MDNKKILCILSGGQDSLTCLYWAIKNYDYVEAISFNYGQNHSVELHQAKKVCEIEGVKQTVIDISFLNTIVESALVSKGDVNQLNAKNLPASFVPNRNQIFITLAHAYAQKVGITNLVTGVCGTDRQGYPDTRDPYIKAIEWATNLGSQDNIKIHVPLMYLTKSQTFKLAYDMGRLEEILEHSHTCYNGNREQRHNYGYGCDNCPACNERRKGYEEFLQSQQLQKQKA